jgi:hypothetical protein
MSEILIGESACLLGEQVRHDAGHGRNGFLLEELAPHGARRLIGRDPGAWLITLGVFLAFALLVVLWFTDSRHEAFAMVVAGVWLMHYAEAEPAARAVGGAPDPADEQEARQTLSTPRSSFLRDREPD